MISIIARKKLRQNPKNVYKLLIISGQKKQVVPKIQSMFLLAKSVIDLER